MYIAIHVQPNRENWVMIRFQQMLETTGMSRQVILHRLERTVVKLVGGKLKEVKENIFPGYLIAEIKGVFNDEMYRLLSNVDGVRRVLYQLPVSEEEFARARQEASKGIVQIPEPEVPKYRRDNGMLNRMEKAVTVPSITKATARRLRACMEKIREQHRRYQAYIRHLGLFAPFRTFTGRKDVLQFPLEALAAARRRLFDVPFGWDDPAQLALRLWFSLQAKLE